MEGATIAKLLKNNDRTYADADLLVIGHDGEQLGLMKLGPACTAAQNVKLDLVLVAENATPPVCRIMDFGKLCYEQKKKLKDQKKKNLATQKTKGIRFRLHIDTNDFNLKIRQGAEFLEEGSKLKINLQLRGRELAHQDMAFELANRIVEALSEVGNLEDPPKLFGKSIQIAFTPKATR